MDKEGAFNIDMSLYFSLHIRVKLKLIYNKNKQTIPYILVLICISLGCCPSLIFKTGKLQQSSCSHFVCQMLDGYNFVPPKGPYLNTLSLHIQGEHRLFSGWGRGAWPIPWWGIGGPSYKQLGEKIQKWGEIHFFYKNTLFNNSNICYAKKVYLVYITKPYQNQGPTSAVPLMSHLIPLNQNITLNVKK